MYIASELRQRLKSIAKKSDQVKLKSFTSLEKLYRVASHNYEYQNKDQNIDPYSFPKKDNLEVRIFDECGITTIVHSCLEVCGKFRQGDLKSDIIICIIRTKLHCISTLTLSQAVVDGCYRQKQPTKRDELVYSNELWGEEHATTRILLSDNTS